MKYKKIIFFICLILFLLLKIKNKTEFFEEQKKIYLISNDKKLMKIILNK